ncbi:hypothetical protein [Peribacillus asahii]|uniref:hypothetical protein n=1 Tax=Peribacillus asahii TaxID=228899 RepID=UPI00381E4C3B
MPRYIRYLEGGQYKYASVKSVGDIDLLKIDAPDLVTAINSLVEGGVIELVQGEIDKVQLDLDSTKTTVYDQIQLVNSIKEAQDQLIDKEKELRITSGQIVADVESVKTDLTQTKDDLELARNDLDSAKAELLNKVNLDTYQEQYTTIVEEVSKKANDIDVQSIVDGINQDVANQSIEIGNAKTDIVNLDQKVDTAKSELVGIIDTVETSVGQLNSTVAQQKIDLESRITTVEEGANSRLDTAKSELNTSIDNVKEDVTSLQGTVTADKQELIDKINADVSGANALIDALEGRVTQSELDITDVNTEITTAKQSISTTASNLETAKTDLQGKIDTANAELSATKTSLEGTKSELSATKTDLQGKIDTSNQNITNLQGRTSTVEGNITTINQEIDDVKGEVSTTITNLGNVEGRMSEAETKITQQAGKIDLKAEKTDVYTKTEVNTALGGKVDNTVYNNKIAEIELTTDGITQTVSDIETTVGSQGSRISSAETTIGQHASAIALKASQSSLDTLSGEVDSVQSELTIQAGKIESKVEKSDYNELEGRVTNQQSSIEQLSDSISQKVEYQEYDELTQQVSVQETQILQTASDVTILATKSEEIDGRLVNAEASIVTQAGQISLKAEQTEVDELNQSIATANSQLTVQAGQIATKVEKTDHDALAGRVSTAESSITQQAGQIALKAEASNVYTKSEADGKLSGKVNTSTYNTKMSQIDLTTSGITQRVTDTEGEIDAITGEITNVKSDVSTLEQTAGQIQTTVSGIQTDLDAVEGRMSTAETQITQNKNDITLRATKTEVDAIESRVDTAEATLTVQAGEISSKVSSTTYTTDKTALQNDINSRAKQSDLTTLTGRVSTAESSITQHTNAISLKAEKSDVYTKSEADGKISGAVDTAKAEIKLTTDGISQSVSNVDTKVNNIQIGGRNLFKKTREVRPVSTSNVSNATVTENGQSFIKTTLTTASGYAYHWAKLAFELSDFQFPQTYTVSADIRATTGTKFRFGGRSNAVNGSHESFYPTFMGTGKWERVSAVFTFTREYDNVLVLWGGSVSAIGDTIEIKNIKYEKGNKATDYTIAPEDIDSSFSAVNQSISNIDQKADAIQLQVTGIDNTVDAQGETILSHTTSIGLMQDSINLKAEKTDVYTKTEVNNKVSTDISNAKAEIKLTTDGISQEVSRIDTTIGEHDSRLVNQQSSIEQLADSISQKVEYAEYDQTTQQMAIQETQILQTASDVTVLANRTTESENRLSVAESSIQVNADAIATKVEKTDFDNLKGTVTSQGTTITQHANAIALKAEASNVYTKGETDTKLGSKVDNSTYNAKIAEIKLTTDGITSSVSAVDQKVNGIQVGGRNLASINKWVNWGGTLTKEGYLLHINTATSAGGSGVSIKASDLGLLPNTQYILSFKIKQVSGTLTRIGGHTDATFATRKFFKIDGVENASSFTGTGAVPSLSDGNWHEIIYSFMTPATIVDANMLYIQPNRSAYTHPLNVDIKDIQIEKGNMPTEWSPMPEDIDTQFSTVSSNISTVDQKADSIQSSVTSLTSTVTSQGTTIASQGTSITQLNNSVALKAEKADVYTKTEADGKISTAVNSAKAEIKLTTDGISQSVTAVDTKINNLKIGGRNIFLTSGNFGSTVPPVANWYSNGGGLSIDTAEKWNGYNTIKTTVGTGISGKWYKLENDVEYTYSAMIKSTEAFTGTNTVPLHYHAGLANTNQSGKITVIKKSVDYTAEDIGKYKLIYVTFKLTGDADSFRPFIYWGSGTRVFNIGYIKLEKGNIATDFNPAIEDIDANFSTVNSSISTVDQKADSIQSSVTSLSSTVTSQGTTIASQGSSITQLNNAVALKAEKSDVYTKTEADGKVTSAINTAKSEIKVTTDGISQSVSNVDAKVNTIGRWAKDYKVNTATPLNLVDENGNALSDDYTYEVTGRTMGTGTNTTAIAIFKSNKAGTSGTGWTLEEVYTVGKSSNHPEFFIDANGKPSVRLYAHSSLYTVEVTHERVRARTNANAVNRSDISTVNQYASTIDQKADGIAIRVTKTEGDIGGLTGRVGTAETNITANTNAIALKASQSSLDTLTGRVSSAESALTVQAGQIATKVSQTDYDNAVGVNKWIARRYNVDLGGATAIPNFNHIKGKQPVSVIEYLDASKLQAFSGDKYIAHYFTNVYLATAKTVALTVTQDDSSAIYMNGAMISEATGTASKSVSLSLRAGWNTVEILMYDHSGTEHVTLGKKLSDNVDKMTAVIGVGDKNETRLTQAETAIQQTSDAILLKADSTTVTNIGNRVTATEGSITVLNNAIVNKVEQTDFNAYSQRVSNAESTITQLSNEITQKVNKTDYDVLNGIVTDQTTQIQQLNESISLKVGEDVFNGMEERVSSTETELSLTQDEILLKANRTEVDTLTGRVSDAEASLSVQADQIATKVAKTEVDVYAGAVKKVRYIRDHSNGSTANTGNHFVEIKAFVKGVNVAKGKTVTASASGVNLTRVTDDSTDANVYAGASVSGSTAWVQVDLGEVREDIDTIQVWHYYGDGRTYYKTKTEISTNGTDWQTVFDSDITGTYKETADGNTIPINLGKGLSDAVNRIKSAETAITQTNDSIALKADKSTTYTKTEADGKISGAITDAKAEIKLTTDGITQSVSNVDSKINNLSIGGRNLLRNSGTPVTSSIYNMKDCTLTQTLAVDTEVTVSLKGQLGTGKTSFTLYNSGGTQSLVSLTPSDRGSDGVYRKTFKWKVGTTSNTFVRVYQIPSSTVVDSTIEWIRLEKGNKATADWTPAPEDIDASFTSVNSSISTIDQKADSIQLSVTNLSSTVDGQGTRLTGAEAQITANTNAIALKASQTSLDSLGTRMSTAESALSVQAGQISSKVSQTDFDNATGIKNLTILNGTELLNLEFKSNAGTTNKPFATGSYTFVPATEVTGGTANEANIIKTVNTQYLFTPYIACDANSPNYFTMDVFNLTTNDGTVYAQACYYDKDKVSLATNETALNMINNKANTSADTWQTHEGFLAPLSKTDIRQKAVYMRIRVITRYSGKTGTTYLRNISWKQLNPQMLADAQSRLATAESTITQQADQILLKVSKDGVISSINQSAEGIKINASKIDITGLVTFSAMDSATQSKITKGESAGTTVDSWKTPTKTTINGAMIETGTLVVGDKVSMGPNAYIAWDKVTGKPNIPNATYIDANGVYTGMLKASSDTSSFTMKAGYGELLSSNGEKMQISPTGIKGFNSNGTQRFSMDNLLVTSSALATSNMNVYLGTKSGGEVRITDAGDYPSDGSASSYSYRNLRCQDIKAYGNIEASYISTNDFVMTGDLITSGTLYSQSTKVATESWVNGKNYYGYMDVPEFAGTWIYGNLHVDDFITTDAVDTGAYHLYVRANSGYEVKATRVGYTDLYVPVRASSHPTGSSINYKTNVVEMSYEDAKYIMDNTNVFTYHLKNNIESGIYDKPKVGMIAEMVPQQLRDEDGVDPYSITATLFRVVKQQDKEIASLNLENDNLQLALNETIAMNEDQEARLISLEEKVAQLETLLTQQAS